MVISVRKNNDGESNESLIRRFVRKVQASGTLILVKHKQFRQPIKSKRLRRRSAIQREASRLQREHLRKIDKLEVIERKKKPSHRH